MKINRTLIILSLLLVFCISLSAVSATEDISVNDDSVATVESSAMNEEINAVGDGKILNSSENKDIEQASGVYHMEYDYQIDKTWNIDNNYVTIDGRGHTIYGNGKQAFDIFGEMVTIKNLNFVNCSASGNGGAIYFQGKGSLENCSFVNCSTVRGFGGAIYFKSDGVVRYCSFVNCSASNGMGGAIYLKGSDGVVRYCSFVNCSAKNYMFSAIYDINMVTVEECSFENCKGKDNNGSYPVFKPKVILNVDDVKGVSGSTVKVDVGVHDILGEPINEGTVIISLNGKEYTAKVVNGIATFNIIIPSKEAIYFANVLFNGEGTRYDNTTCNFTVINILDNNGNATGNDTKDINKSVVSNKINNVINIENCGNPLIALLIALISLPLIRRK